MAARKRRRKKKDAGKKRPATAAPQPGRAKRPDGQPTISLCMIVKNEERRLPDALKSAQPWVDEIIVVDTGSTDRTVEIAESFGAKVYHHPWQHSFSIHRNQSISYATGDWLLILDADEVLDQETAPQIRELVKAPPPINCFLFELYNDTTLGGETMILHPRLFRNGVGFHYEGLVHNRPVVTGKVARSKVRLIHFGYNEDPRTMERKHERRLEMIRKWVEQEPENFRAYSYLAHTLLSRAESLAEAAETAAKALELARQTNQPPREYPHIYYALINSLALLERDDEAMQHAQDCLAIMPVYPDPLFFICAIHYKRQQWEKVVETAEHFARLQADCRARPDHFIFFENMTYDQLNQVYFRWAVALGQLGREEEMVEVFQRMFSERGAEEFCALAVRSLMAGGKPEAALRLAREAAQLKPEWAWPEQALRLAQQKMSEQDAAEIRRQGLAQLESGQTDQGLAQLMQAAQVNPTDAEVLQAVAKALDQRGDPQAEAWLVRALNVFPGYDWAWRRLAEICFARGDYAGAEACYRRWLGQTEQEDERITQRLGVCLRRLQDQPPTVAQQPPKLVVFLVGGMSPEMVRQPAPHFLIGRAWGAFLDTDSGAADAVNWATIFTGVEPHLHGLEQDPPWQQPVSFTQLKVPTLWELMPPGTRLGLVAVPLGYPLPELEGWAIAGLPAGVLHPQLVRPSELTPLVLAQGYRTDYVLTELELGTRQQRLEADVRQEAFLYQTERHKIETACRLPAVDVLVIGFTMLEHMQQTFDLAQYHTFNAYQHLYACIESLLAALRPRHFAVLSQRGYAAKGRRPSGGGFYCLSWLRGQNRQAKMTDVAPEILRLMGGDLQALGRPRG